VPRLRMSGAIPASLMLSWHGQAQLYVSGKNLPYFRSRFLRLICIDITKHNNI
jgi:hypothetical protein